MPYCRKLIESTDIVADHIVSLDSLSGSNRTQTLCFTVVQAHSDNLGPHDIYLRIGVGAGVDKKKKCKEKKKLFFQY